MALNPSTYFTRNSAFRSRIARSLSLPLFNGGRLQGMLDLREAQQQEAALAYQQTVLRAWHEIDDQLTRYNASQLRRDSLAEAVRQIPKWRGRGMSLGDGLG